jgi:hypothetical protein
MISLPFFFHTSLKRTSSAHFVEPPASQNKELVIFDFCVKYAISQTVYDHW